MSLEYTGEGTIKISGCVCPIKNIYILTQWAINSYAFLKYKAQRGIMEKISIKKVIVTNKKIGSVQIVLYQDTLNSLYNESDLITEEEAKYLAQVYWLTQLEQYQRNSC
jgi:hypothetical protein